VLGRESGKDFIHSREEFGLVTVVFSHASNLSGSLAAASDSGHLSDVLCGEGGAVRGAWRSVFVQGEGHRRRTASSREYTLAGCGAARALWLISCDCSWRAAA
jgi:hypothetical protein